MRGKALPYLEMILSSTWDSPSLAAAHLPVEEGRC